jgi:hypothetical protein
MMAAVAGWRNDISGRLITGGTGAAYTLTSNQGFTTQALMDGAMMAFTASATNTAGATLNVDGLGASPIIVDTISGTTPVPAGSMTGGSVYRATYYQSGNTWRLEGYFSQSYNVPLGGIIASTLLTAPNSSFVVANGQCISQTTYATYYAAMGSPGVGTCGAGLFPVLDLRSRVPVGLDESAGRLTSAGCGIVLNTIGAPCPSAFEARPLALSYIPTITGSVSVSVSGSISGSTSLVLVSGSGAGVGGGGAFGVGGNASVSGSFSGSGTGSMTSNNTGGGSPSPFPIMNPNVGVRYYVRVI